MRTLFIIIFLIQPLIAQEVFFESKSSYHLEKNDMGTFRTKVTSAYNTKGNFVIHEILTDRLQFGADGSSGLLEATAYRLDEQITPDKIWTLKDFAQKTYFFDNFYVTEEEGCCDSENTRSYYNIKNGEKVFSSNAVLKIQFSNRIPFYISFISISSTKDFPPQFTYDTNIKMILSLSSENQVISRLLILCTKEFSDFDHTPDDIYFLDTNSRTSKLSKPYTNIESLSNIHIEFDYWGTVISVSVENGQLSVNNSDNHEGFEFIAVTGEEKDSYLYFTKFQNLRYKSKDELRILRNEIFARNGHSFKSQDLKEYFSDFYWYEEKPAYKVSEEDLSKYEKIVLKKIQDFENQK